MAAVSAPPSFHPSPTRPELRLPQGACDAHCHIFGPQVRFPLDPRAPFHPADAPKEALFALHALLGIDRCVIVQSMCHGFDNAVVAEAIASKGGTYLGVALAPTTVTMYELRKLDAQGFRGLRFNFMKHLGASAPVERIIGLTPSLAELGWHLQVHFESTLIGELSPWFRRSAVPVVIDHMGRVDASQGLAQEAFQALMRLLDDTRMWVKVSGADRVSRSGPPYADAVPFARTLVERFGDRTLWGTDWPHPNTETAPDDGVLTDALSYIAPLPAQRHALLVANPQRLYRFRAPTS